MVCWIYLDVFVKEAYSSLGLVSERDADLVNVECMGSSDAPGTITEQDIPNPYTSFLNVSIACSSAALEDENKEFKGDGVMVEKEEITTTLPPLSLRSGKKDLMQLRGPKVLT